MNLLDMIVMEEVDCKKAEEILDYTIDKYHESKLLKSPQVELSIDKYEWTAIGFGIDLCVLAKWRSQGWPSKCINCNIEIDYKKFGWKIDGNKLVCVKCR